MAEEVNTGGRKRFVSKGRPELDDELAKKIDEGYKKAEIRKAKERKRRIIRILIGTGVALIVIVALLVYFLL